MSATAASAKGARQPTDHGILTVPNLISIGRLACVPLFLWLLLGREDQIAAAVLLAVLGATDWVDGWIARHFDQASEVGKVLDPTADRILLLCAGLALLADGSLPLWVGVVVLAREAVISVAVLVLAARGRSPHGRAVGREGGNTGAHVRPARLPSCRRDLGDPGADAGRDLGVHDRRPRAQLLRRRRVHPAGPGCAAGGTGVARREDGGVKAVILAGGEGTRLRPLTSNQPKPMMPLANRPMMEHVVRLLASHGFDDVVVTVAFLANQIRDYFGDGSDFGVRMRYATEETPLGTAGSVLNASEELDDTFLVISGDVLTDIDLGAIVKAHQDAGALASIALKRVENPLEFAIVITRPDGSIERFLEKPSWGEVFSDTANTGIYVLEPGIFDFIRADEVVDFAGDVFPAVLEKKLPLIGTVVDGYWEDVGTLEAYLRAHQDVLDRRVHVDIDGFRIGEGIWLGEDADVDPTARIEGPVVIGDNCRIEAGAHLREYTVLGTDVVVKSDAFVERAVCHDHVYVGPSARLRGCVIGRSTDLRAHARIEEGVVVGDECFVGEQAVINPGVKVYPFKTVENGPSSTRRSCGRAAAPAPSSAGGGSGAGQRRRHAGGRDPGRDGVRHRAQEGRHRHHQP